MAPAPRSFPLRGAAIAGALALLTLPPGALAEGEALEFRISNDISPAQPSATIELWAHFDRRDWCFGGALLDVLATEPGWSDLRLIMPWPGPGTKPGVVAGSRVEGVLAAQVHEPFHPGDPTNPMPLWAATFTVSDFAPRSISLGTLTSDFRVHPDVSSSRSVAHQPVEGAAEIIVIPSPGILPLALAVLAIPRRRRS